MKQKIQRNESIMHPDVIVAGHICLDIIPSFLHQAELAPGALINMGPAVVATGGAVSNTGIALHRLGLRTRLMGKVGDDLFGRALLDTLRQQDAALADGMIVDPDATTSYSVVINPPQTDRTFLHHTGANDTFTARDIDPRKLEGARLFHFGYPTLMRSIYSDGGREMEAIFRLVKSCGLMTSLDMSMPDPNAEVGRVEWIPWLKRVLPLVDLYLPSLEETRRMLRQEAPPEELVRTLQSWGARIVGLKLGDQGLCCRWENREYRAPCFEVNVVGATGAGDCTIAGFIAGWLRGQTPDDIMTTAVAVGACCCEAPDATSGVRSWDETQARIAQGWARKS